MNELLILGPVTLAISIYVVHRLRLPAERIGLVDLPGGRKSHFDPTPLVGGVGMFVAFAFGALLLSAGLNPYRALFAGMGLLLIVGILDDMHDLGAREKFALHLAAALVLVFGGDLAIENLGTLPLLGYVDLGIFAVPFTLICVAGLINAVNMLDGLDGLAGITVLSILFWLIVLSLDSGGTAVALPVLLASALVGFLAFNFPVPWRRCAHVFMGDSGSTILGFALAWFAIEIVFVRDTAVAPVTIAWIMALPIFDAICLMLRRTLKGQNPMAADREHLHHIFLRAGFSSRTTVYIAALTSFAMGGIGVLLPRLGVPEPLLWIPLLALFVLHWLLVRHAWKAMRLLRERIVRDVA